MAAGLAAGAIRAFHEAGLWNHFQDVVFDLSNVLTTHSLTGTLLEGIFGYQETPSVSEVAVYFIYLIPALALFFYAIAARHAAVAYRVLKCLLCLQNHASCIQSARLRHPRRLLR